MTRQQLRAYQYWAVMNGFKPIPVKWGWNYWKTRQTCQSAQIIPSK